MKILRKWLRKARAPARVPSNTVVYVVGDVHGHSDLLDGVFARIDADRGALNGKRVVEVYLGDYVDRGPDSKGVLDRLIYRGEQREIIPLLGNHEEMMLSAMLAADAFEPWMRVGGRETVASYGIRLPAASDAAALADCQAGWAETVPEAHRTFLSELHYTTEIGDYLFVHAGLRPGVPLDRQNGRDLLWIRDEFLESRLDHGRIVVHGHTPVEQPEFHANRINIDTGAYLTGRLTCLRLMGESRELIS